MTRDTMKEAAVAAEVLLFDNWFDAIDEGKAAAGLAQQFTHPIAILSVSGQSSRSPAGARACRLGDDACGA